MTFEEVAESHTWMVVEDKDRAEVDTFAMVVELPILDSGTLYGIVERATTSDEVDIVEISPATYAVLYWIEGE